MKNHRQQPFRHATRQAGSALIITMLIVAAISAAAFGLSRIFLVDVRIAGSAEDSLKAYYLAEAGIEEGLLRYRVDRNNELGLNVVPSSPTPPPTTLGDGTYTMSTTFLTSDRLTRRVPGRYSFDTIGEYDGGNTDFRGPPAGRVPQDETVEVATPESVEEVRVQWRWEGGIGPANPECGVEITSVLRSGGFERWLIGGNSPFFRVPATGGRTAIRVKPVCQPTPSYPNDPRNLDWLAFGARAPIGRTLQTIESTGVIGRAKRKLQATVNRRSGSIVGLFDFVLGSEECLIIPTPPSCPP